MSRRILSSLAALGFALTVSACATPTTRPPVMASDLGVPATGSEMKSSLTRPGIVTFERIAFAHWTGGRGSFIDRDDPAQPPFLRVARRRRSTPMSSITPGSGGS